MDVEPVPTIDFSSSMGEDSETAYSLERADVDGKLTSSAKLRLISELNAFQVYYMSWTIWKSFLARVTMVQP